MRSWNDVLDVKRGNLEGLAHSAIFATSGGSCLHDACDRGRDVHVGSRPSRCNALARTMASVSLNSTSDSNSSRSVVVNVPSLFRSMNWTRQNRKTVSTIQHYHENPIFLMEHLQ